jgi:2,3-bisphosphoglycerate-independent phosphoglycerate mutase
MTSKASTHLSNYERGLHRMKYVIIHGDGMADWPCEELGGKTPLEAAHKPNMDLIATHGRLGLVATIPTACNPAAMSAL